jgi:NADH dehydrogenase/NADH:ubiquinone oxidoreductase subunit G|tara:strand:+ start:248 stop:394 length:147 start_codon:yes stop_codon:yes gene_type:complete
MIGNCFDCLVEIDGETNLQACLVTVRDGMRIRSHPGNGPGDDSEKGKA